jgi:hypothetical protein
LVFLVLQGWLCLAEGCKSEAILQLPLQGETGSKYRQIVKGGTSGVLTLAISVNDLSLGLHYLHFSAPLFEHLKWLQTNLQFDLTNRKGQNLLHGTCMASDAVLNCSAVFASLGTE